MGDVWALLIADGKEGDAIEEITGRGMAVVGNEVYAFRINAQIPKEKKSSIEKQGK